jgi:phage/plasmid-associated DNA primase
MTQAQERIYAEDPEFQGDDDPQQDTSPAGAAKRNYVPDLLETGSDVELAQALHLKLRHTYGEVVFCEGKFWHYGETHWVELAGTELWRMAFGYNGMRYGKKDLMVKLAAGRVESIVKCLEKLCDQPDFFRGASRGVNCLSGFVEFDKTGEPNLLPHIDSHRQRHTLQGCWNSDYRIKQPPEGSLIHTLLYGSTMGDPEQPGKIEALLRLAGATVAGLGTRGINPRCVVLKGESKAGKSQLQTLFRGLVPTNAQCSISPSQFADKNFLADLAGKLLNTYDELGSTYAVTSEVFKSVITGEPVKVCRKYGHPFDFKPQAQNIFACNLLPAFRGGVDPAVLNRLYILQFDRVIPVAERIENIGTQIVTKEMDLLLGLAIEGASRLIKEKGFPRLDSSETELEELAETDSVILWFKDRVARTQLEKINEDGTRSPVWLTIRQLYDNYKTYAEEQGHDQKSLVGVNAFSARLRSHGLKRVKLHGSRGFAGVCFKSEPGSKEERKPAGGRV